MEERAAQAWNRALRAIAECNQALVRATDEMGLLNKVCSIRVEVGGYRLASDRFCGARRGQERAPVALAGLRMVLDVVRLTWGRYRATDEAPSARHTIGPAPRHPGHPDGSGLRSVATRRRSSEICVGDGLR